MGTQKRKTLSRQKKILNRKRRSRRINSSHRQWLATCTMLHNVSTCPEELYLYFIESNHGYGVDVAMGNQDHSRPEATCQTVKYLLYHLCNLIPSVEMYHHSVPKSDIL